MNGYLAISCLLALTVSVHGSGLGYGEKLVYAPRHASADYYTYPRYAFEYAVKDPHTGDNKAQWERRDGDVVKGAYSLVEPDGSLRVVEYWADDRSGFNAVVKRIGPNLHPTTVPASIYKAPIPVLGGLGHGPSHGPISVGPVARLEGLAAAPLITGPLVGGAVSTANLVKSSIVTAPIAPIIRTPIAPIAYEPIAPIARPIVPVAPLPPSHAGYGGPLPAHEGLSLPGPIIRSGPILEFGGHYPSAPIVRPAGYYGGNLPINPAPLPVLRGHIEGGYGGYDGGYVRDHGLADLGHGLLSLRGNHYHGQH